MIKKIVLLAVAFTILGVVLAEDNNKDIQLFLNIVDECNAKLGLSGGWKIIPPAADSDAPLLLCVLTKSGDLDSNGKVIADGVRNELSKTKITKKWVEKIVEECAKDTSENAEKNALELYNCLHRVY